MTAAMARGTAARLLAQNVRVLRLMRGWSQGVLAKAAEPDPAALGAQLLRKMSSELAKEKD